MAHPQTNFSSNFQGVDPPLEGYWHDDPIPCGSGNVVTDIWPNPAGVPVVVKGINALTAEDIVDKLDKTGSASNTTSTFVKATGDASTMTSGSRLSAIFTAISSFFASLKALAFEDKASYNDLSSGVQSSLDKADTAYQKPSGGIPDSDIASALTWNGKQDSLGISASGDTSKFLNERGVFATPNYPSVPSVINNLTSNSTTDALSAAQGKALNDKLTATSFYGQGVDLILSKKMSAYDHDAACFRISYARGNTNYYDQLIYIQTPSAQSDISPLGGGSITAITNSLGAVLNVGYKIVGDTIEYHFYAVTSGNSVFRVYAGGGIQSVYSISAGPHASDLTNLSYNKIYMSTYSEGGKGSPTTPVYVDSNGQVQECTASNTLKTNTATLYIAGYYNTTPVYHVKDIKNGCINYVHVKNTSSSNCNLTIEAPTLAADEEYDYVVVFDTFTNNNLVGNIDVENCKTTGHFESGVFVHDTMAIPNTVPSQVPMIIVTGNVARPQWYDRV